jgi:hypothetical protein
VKINLSTVSGPMQTESLATAEIMGYRWFVHKDDFDDYRVSEWETGMCAYHCSADGMTQTIRIAEALKQAEAHMISKGQARVDKVIKQARETFGTVNPPYQP